MPPTISIVIPCYNSAKTLKQCCDAIINLDKPTDLEVIFVDDGSTDGSLEIVRQYPFQIIEVKPNRGASHARNLGAEKAKNDIILFLDADIVVPKDVLAILIDKFSDKTIDCIVGIMSPYNPFPDFYSQYKSLYCFFKYKDLKGVSAINTSFTAVKKTAFETTGGFDTKLSVAEDNDFGDRLFKKGFKIQIERSLVVIHLKGYSFKSLLRNDYKKSLSLATLFFRNIKRRDLAVKREFTDISYGQMLNVPLVFLVLFLSALGLLTWSHPFFWLGAFFTLIFIINNFKFWQYLWQSKGLFFTSRSLIFTFLDYVIVGLAVLKGALELWNKNA